MTEKIYDVIVVGAGHAGIEAAMAAARIGCQTLLLTMNLDLICKMSCNPSVGGPAKGHVVREIGALGGEMARAIDRNFIQIKLLNPAKGPAVQALRAQADKRRYSIEMKHALERTPNLHLKEGQVERLLVENDRVVGVETRLGWQYRGKTVVLTTGTFLRGRVMSGEHSHEAGRMAEFPARGISASLKEVGFKLVRLQTNTPPRVDARTVDFSQTTPQPGSAVPLYFSFDADDMLDRDSLTFPAPNPIYPIEYQTAWRPQVPCYLTYSNQKTHDIVRENIHRSPIAPGKIEAAGPRYCPSFEEKVVRFSHKERHQIFLEPEGWETNEVYVQGLFTGMPIDVQIEMLHSIPALREAEIMRPGYAIEYDHIPARQLHASLETKLIEGLFHAGQINGTSGYEEAAAQGIIAGINAALKAQGKPPLVLRRDQAYLGVLVDDLITKDLAEPYRLLTSRAEYRLLLRQDNADFRLTPIGYEVGLIPRTRYETVEAKRRAVEAERARLQDTWIRPTVEVNELLTAQGINPIDDGVNALQFLRRPEVSYSLIANLVPPPEPFAGNGEVTAQIEIETKYEGYIKQQQIQVDKMHRLEVREIPPDFDYDFVVGLRNEARDKLMEVQPKTVGQATRLAGVNPADISLLLVYLERWKTRTRKEVKG